MADFNLTLRRLREETEADQARENISGPNMMSPDEATAARRAREATGNIFANDIPGMMNAPRTQREFEILDVSPRLRAYLADPENAAEARDDVRPLSLWESVSRQAMSVWGDTAASYRRGERNIERNRLMYRLNPHSQRAYDSQEFTEADRGRMKALDWQDQRDPGSGMWNDLVATVPQLFGGVEASARRAVRDARQAITQVYGDEPRPLTVREAMNQAAVAPIAGVGAVAGVGGGVMRGGAGFIAEQGAGDAYREFLAMRDVDGNFLDPNIAGRAANQVGVLHAAIEFAATATGGKLVGLDDLARRVLDRPVRDALRRAALRDVGGRFALRVGAAGVNEGLEEVAQETVTIFQGLAAQAEQGGEFENATPEQIADRLWSAFSVAAVLGSAIGSVPSGINAGFEMRDVRRARLQGEVFEALSDGAGSSKLKGRSARRYAEAVDRLTEGGPLAEMRVDADRFASFFQDNDQDPFDVADQLRGVGRQALQAAIDAGGEITIPAGTYASQIAGTPADAALREHVRIGPNEMTPAEVQGRIEIGVDLERAVGEARRIHAQVQAAQSEQAEVVDRIETMLTEANAYIGSANRTYAQFLASNIMAHAKANGIRPMDLIASVGLDVRGPFDSATARPLREQIYSRLNNVAADIPANETPRDLIRVARPRGGDAVAVSAREATEDSEIATSWGPKLQARAGRDMIVGEAEGDARPVRRDIFEATYEADESGRYRKRRDAVVGYYRLDAPRTIQTLEGAVDAKKGDYVLIGAVGEQWPIPAKKFRERYIEVSEDPYAHFGGVNAVGAPLHTLLTARTMYDNATDGDGEISAEDTKKIWEATGWERGEDGMWRFEIDDTDADWKNKNLDRYVSETHLGEVIYYKGDLDAVLDFENLFSAYRVLGSLQLTLHIGPYAPEKTVSGIIVQDRPHGTLNSDGIYVRAATRELALNIIMHELQHAVQWIEALAPGGGPGAVLADVEASGGTSMVSKAYNYFYERALKVIIDATGAPSLEQIEQTDSDLHWNILNDARNSAAFAVYQNLLGEMEARAVNLRRGETFGTRKKGQNVPALSREQRRSTPPSASYDVPASRVVVLPPRDAPLIKFKSLESAPAPDIYGDRWAPGLGRAYEDRGDGAEVSAPVQASADDIGAGLKSLIEKIDANEVVNAHPTARKFGTDEEIIALQAMIDRKASAEEILASPIMQAVEQHSAETPWTATPEQAADPDFFEGREYVDPRDGEIVDAEEAIERLKEIYESKSGGIPRREFRAVIVVGHPGAGKSTFIGDLARTFGAAVLDADIAKEFVPTYEGGLNSQSVHFESAGLRAAAQTDFLDSGTNVVIERVGDNAVAMRKAIQQLETSGYSVSMVHVDVDGAEAARRMASRFLSGGRYVDPAIFRVVLDKPKPAFAAVIENAPLAGYVEINANGPPGQIEVTQSGGGSASVLLSAIGGGARSGVLGGSGTANNDGNSASAASQEGPGYAQGEVTIEGARAEGYQGNDTGEAREWLAAIAKGLPMDDGSRMRRAREQGFDIDTPLYHGTDTAFDAFSETAMRRNDSGFYGRGTYFTTEPGEASYYAETRPSWQSSSEPVDGANVVPAYARGRLFEVVDGGNMTEIVPRFLESLRGMKEVPERARELADMWEDAARSVKVEQAVVHMDPQNRRMNWGIPDEQIDADGGATVWRDASSGVARYYPSRDAAVAALTHDKLARAGHRFPLGVDAAIQKSIGPDEFTAFLRANGYDGVRAGDEVLVFDSRNIRSRFAAFDPDAAESANLLAQGSPRTGPRGYFTPGYDRNGELNSAVINLLEARNLSTLLHETGHLNLELLMMFAARDTAPQAIKDDAQTIFDWFGGNLTMERWQAMSIDERRPYHEQFARGFEAYVFEGKSPSMALRQVFATIRTWLVNIYKSVLALKVDLNDEVRAVMDRMVATDEEIAAAQKANGADQVMSREQFGGTEKQYARYLKTIERARQEAEADLQANVMAALFADRTREWRAEEKRQRTTVELDVDADPARIALDWLAFGLWRHGPKPDWATDDLRLSLKAVLDDYGQDAYDGLPPELRKVDADDLVKQAVATRVALNKRGPQRLADWLQQYARRYKGIIDESKGLEQVLDGKRGFGRVINPNGERHLEDAAMAAWEAGFFGPPPGRVVDGGYAQEDVPSAGNASVRQLRQRIDPFGNVNPWDETQRPISIAEVRAAMLLRRNEPGTFSHGPPDRNWTRQDHINRIATLARSGLDDPIAIAEGGGVHDGLHRLAAAIVRGDDTIPTRAAPNGAWGQGDSRRPPSGPKMQHDGVNWQIVDASTGSVIQELPRGATAADARAALAHALPDGGNAGGGQRVVYRGLNRPYDPANGGYYQAFTSSLDDAREYGPNVIAAHINPGRNLAIDGGGNNFNALSVAQLPDDVRARLHPSVGGVATTDQIAHAAREAGYDSVTVRNVHDNRWGERPVSGASPRTIDFVFNTENISPLDHVPPQMGDAVTGGGATLANARGRLSDSDRALLDELYDGLSDQPPQLPNASNGGGYAQDGAPVEREFKPSLRHIEKWGDTINDEASITAALRRIVQIRNMTPINASWDELRVAVRDLAELFENSVNRPVDFTSTVAQDRWHFGHQVLAVWDRFDSRDGLVLQELLAHGNDAMRSRNRVLTEIAETVREWRNRGVRRKGLLDLFREDIEADPRNKRSNELGMTQRNGFYSAVARAVKTMPDRQWQMGGEHVINWLLKQPGVKREEIDFLELPALIGRRDLTREELERYIADRELRLKARFNSFDPENPSSDYNYGGTRAFSGPRVPGRGVYFEDRLAFPKRRPDGRPFAPGFFESPHWDNNEWGAIRGSIRDVPGYGKTVLAEEVQKDMFQGAQGSDPRRPRVSSEQYLSWKAQRGEFQQARGRISKLLRSVRRVVEDINYADRVGTYDLIRAAERWEDGDTLDVALIRLSQLHDVVSEAPESDLRATALRDLDALASEMRKSPEYFEHDAFKKFSDTESSFTPDSPFQNTSSDVLLKRLLIRASREGADAVAISTSETTARIQNNSDAAFFYDEELRVKLERVARQETGDQSLTIERVNLPTKRGMKAYSIWIVRVPAETRARIRQRGISYFQGDSVRNGERPTIREFLDRLNDDIRNDASPVYSSVDAEEVANRLEYQSWANWFAERGVDLKAPAKELRAQIERALSKDNGGLHPDVLASVFGFDSGAQFLRAISTLKPREEAIKEETRARLMEEMGGDPFADGSIAEEARIAAHRESRARAIELELDAIERASGGTRPVSAAAKDIARRQMESMTVKQVRGYDWFLSAERREARNAIEAIRKGDMTAARMHKHRQLVNFHLYRLARDAAEEMDKAQTYLRKFDRPGVRDKIDGDYLDQIDDLLEGYELRKTTQRRQRSMASLNQWAQDMEARGLGHLVDVDPRVLSEAARRPFVRLPLDEARGLIDTIRNIEHLGRLKDKLLAAQEKRAFRETVDGVVEQLVDTGALAEPKRRTYTPTAVQRVNDTLRKAHAEMVRMEFLFKHLDGKANGPIWRTLWAPLAAAADKETALMRRATTEMNAIWARYGKGELGRMFNKRIETPELPVRGPMGTATSFTKIEIITIALNWGNEGNRAAILNGFGWSEERVQAVLDREMDARDWETVQSIWDLIGTFRDEAFAMHEDLTGVRPKAVEAMPVETKFGTFKGGYYPLKYDGERDIRQNQDDKRAESLENWGSHASKAMTRKGHLEARVGSGGRPVKLSIAVFTEHVNNVSHDIAYRRAVVDTTRIIEDRAFAEAFIGVAGQPLYDQLTPWLKSIASDRTDPTVWFWRHLQKLRGNVAIAAMGYRLSTGLQQLTGLLQAVPELGSLRMSGAMVKLLRNPMQIEAKARFILDKSEFMRSRMNTRDRDIRETIEGMQQTDKLYPIRHNAFALVGMFDWAVSSTVWTAAYDRAMDGEVKGVDTGDDAAAVTYADSMVRTTQSGGLNQDLPAIMRGTQINKLMTMFFSYFSVLYNWSANQVMDTRRGRIPPHVFIANMALIYIIAPLMAEALAGRLMPRDDESEEERNARVLSVIARMPFQTIPYLRDLVNAAGTMFDYQLSPVESAPKMIIRAGQDLVAGRTLNTENTAKAAVTSIGYMFGLPSGAAWPLIDYIADHVEGEETGFDPYEALVSDRR